MFCEPFNLSGICKQIANTVGPKYDANRFDAEVYYSAIMKTTISNLLNGCNERGYESVALPAISTGLFLFPKSLAAKCVY